MPPARLCTDCRNPLPGVSAYMQRSGYLCKQCRSDRRRLAALRIYWGGARQPTDEREREARVALYAQQVAASRRISFIPCRIRLT